MSHITKHTGQKISDIKTFLEVAANHGEMLETETVKMFGTQEVKAVCSVLLKGWRYPIAVNSQGEVFYDHFGSEANSFDRLGEMLQDYNQTATMKEIPYDLVQNNYTEELANGDKKLVLEYV